MEEPVTIVDRNVLKVLSVDTRMDILKILSEGDRTPSDLSKRLKKTDATIVEHLDVLCKAGLVKKIEQPGKKWIFYTLTERGEGIILSKSRRLVIILGTSLLSGIVGVAGLATYFARSGTFSAPAEMVSKAPVTGIGETGIVVSAAPSILFYLSIGLVVIAIAGASFYFIQNQNSKV